MSPSAHKTSGKKASAGTLRRVLQYLRPQWGALILSLVLTLLNVALTLLLPILTGRAIDCIVGPGQVRSTELALQLRDILLCMVTASALLYIASLMNNRLTYHTVRSIRRETFSRLQRLPLRFLDSHPSGDTVSRMITDVDTFSDGLLLGFTQLFSGVITILGTLIFMLRLSPGIALVVLLLTPLSLLAARFIATRTHSMFTLQSVTRGEQTALLDEAISGQKLVSAFSREAALLSQFDEINGRLQSCSLRATFFSSLVNPVTRFVNAMVYAAVALSGGLTVLAGGLTVGGLTSFLSYANQYTKPFNDISGVITEVQNALACAERVFALMDEEPVSPDPENAAAPETVAGGFTLSHVRFAYEPSRPLIRNLSLTAKPGQRIAIVGPTGCGKTTLINLLMRFYDAEDGEIRMDGIETRQMRRDVLRRNIGMVLQDTWIPAGTVRDIICFGRENVPEEEMIAAAKASHAHSFIRRLPEKYDTFIPENGGSLSQGQKQLLCITRVMLRLPPVLILDEATSSIDIRTEQKIQNAFAEMMRGRTSFVVAHRLSTIQGADLILVMRNGDVVEQGTHESLLQKGGAYAALYRSQFEI